MGYTEGMLTRIAAITSRRRTTDLANAVGVDMNTVSDWKTGKKLPSPRNYEKIAAACGVSVKEVMDAVSDDSVERTRLRNEARLKSAIAQ